MTRQELFYKLLSYWAQGQYAEINMHDRDWDFDHDGERERVKRERQAYIDQWNAAGDSIFPLRLSDGKQQYVLQLVGIDGN